MLATNVDIFDTSHFFHLKAPKQGIKTIIPCRVRNLAVNNPRRKAYPEGAVSYTKRAYQQVLSTGNVRENYRRYNCQKRWKEKALSPLLPTSTGRSFSILRLMPFPADKSSGGQTSLFLYPGVYRPCCGQSWVNHIRLLLRFQRQHDPLQRQNACWWVSRRRNRPPQTQDVY